MPNFKGMKLHLQNIIILGIILYFLTIAAFYTAQIMPLKNHLGYLSHRIKGLSTEVEKLKSQYTQKWEEGKDKVFGIIGAFQQKESEKLAIQEEIFQLAEVSGVEIEKFAPLEDEEISDTMIKYSWGVDCQPNYAKIATFLNKVENSSSFLFAESLSIQSGKDKQQRNSSKKRGESVVTGEVKHRTNLLLSTYRFK